MKVIHLMAMTVNAGPKYVYHYVTTDKADMQAQMKLISQLVDQPYGLKVMTTDDPSFKSVQDINFALRDMTEVDNLSKFKDIVKTVSQK